jgi:hypothetical protein
MSSFLPQPVRPEDDNADADDFHHDEDYDDEGMDQFDMVDDLISTTPPPSPITITPPDGATYTAPLKSAAGLLTPELAAAATTTGGIQQQFAPYYTVTFVLQAISMRVMRQPSQYDPAEPATWIGFWALFLVTCSNFVLMPMRDAIALAVGVEHIPKLTLASTVLAVFSSVPIGWLFEAPDPQRRRWWKRIGLTRGETQGTSLALFYRFFALSLWSYAIGFKAIEFLVQVNEYRMEGQDEFQSQSSWRGVLLVKVMLQHLGKGMYIAFFLVVHLMKQHSISLLWGVATEAMEYEETSKKRHLLKQQKHAMHNNGPQPPTSKTRLQRLAFVGFGGTVGGILGRCVGYYWDFFSLFSLALAIWLTRTNRSSFPFRQTPTQHDCLQFGSRLSIVRIAGRFSTHVGSRGAAGD